MRGFASLPDHIKLEMPNLSPTMEKVSNLSSLFIQINRVTLENGKLKLGRNWDQVMYFAVSKPIKPLLILKFRMKVMLPRFCIQPVQRISHLVLC